MQHTDIDAACKIFQNFSLIDINSNVFDCLTLESTCYSLLVQKFTRFFFFYIDEI